MKWFRVATEGTTADGRHIQGIHLEQMAKNYNPEKYQARIWLEHFRSIMADGIFPAYGDVIALKCETNAEGKKELFAQLAPLPELVKINQSGQKLYTSVEIDPNFADSGEAYLVGLAFTDSPASLGTERLMFNVQAKEQYHLFSTYHDAEFVFNDNEEKDKESLLDKVRALFSKHKQEAQNVQEKQFNQFLQEAEGCFNLVSEQVSSLESKIDGLELHCAELEQTLSMLENQFAQQQENQPDQHYHQRPLHIGGDSSLTTLTDC
ncbi:GPO family capsid scaffolding protein [Histophilus somni]|uniref:GPO family capsid scaffolding protein n=1 Tax=Histophilus somni TaxID=731 RepID=UPI00201F455C|nr:GPO family capsid scaffolding protein [Histophilus somni]